MATNNIINAPIPFTVDHGGTGVLTLTTAYGVLCAGTTATGAVQTVTPGAAGTFLKSNGAAALPSFVSASTSIAPTAFAYALLFGR